MTVRDAPRPPVGIVLAAGAGRRMGTPKALVRGDDGDPWIAAACRLLAHAGCSPVIAVLGAAADDAARLVPPGVIAVVADDWPTGMSASLRAGLDAAGRTDAPAAVITLVDLPRLPPSAAVRLLQPAPASDVLRQATFGGEPGHPVVVGREHWHALAETLQGDHGARGYLVAHGVDEVDCSDLGDGRDVDTLAGLDGSAEHDAPADTPLVARLRAAGCVFAEEEAALLTEAADTGADLEELTARRVTGEPLEHVLGWAGFRGLRIAVGPGVFVPRTRTGLLVEAAAGLLRSGDLAADVCCGSGAIGAALVAEVPGVEVYASDIDPVAVEIARRNIRPDRVFAGDLMDALPHALRGRLRVLVANVPYVPSASVALMPPEAREHEPRVALDGGADGLDLLRRIAEEAAMWLMPLGDLLVEASDEQVPGAEAAMRAVGLEPRVIRSSELEATVVAGRRPGAV